MSYMRGEHYVWSDGENMHIEGVSMPLAKFDELCAMRMAQLTEQQREEAATAAIENWSGNFGCDALRKQQGLPTVMDQLLGRFTDEKAD